jgi:predicted DsbA family dithiol-disulfide isomerase
MVSPSPVPGDAGSRPLRIDVWSDIGCPWCYLGKHRLEQAIAATGDPDTIRVTYRSFELDPTASADPVPVLDMLAAKLGVPPEQAESMESQVAGLARAEGLEYTSKRMHAGSFDMHRVLHLAGAQDQAAEVLGALQRELFSGRANIYDPAELADVASGAGLGRPAVEQVLASEDYAGEVRQDEALAQQIGITGVPFAVLGGRLAVPGAVSVDSYQQAIAQARDQLGDPGA